MNNEIQVKFNNFKHFLTEIEGIDTIYLIALDKCSLGLFLEGLNQYGDMTPHEIVKKICDKSGIRIPEVNEKVKDKFVRYIEYFKQISKVYKQD